MYGNCVKCEKQAVLFDLDQDDICIDCKLDHIEHLMELEKENKYKNTKDVKLQS